VEKCEVLDPLKVRYQFKGESVRDLPVNVAELPVLSKAYYAKVDFTKSTLEPPLGSGPYRIKNFRQGEYVAYERRDDYWAKDLPVNKGRYNFDIVRFEFYRDRDVGFEGFTAKNYLFREEFTARTWATRYDFPAVKDGRVKQAMLPDDTPSGGQGWFMNTRRDKFKNRMLREAIIDAFDFEWTNKTIMYGAYKRTVSVFQNSNMMAEGKPSEAELALLEPFRGKVPDEVFGEPYLPPVSDGSGQDRALLRKASHLLQQAGYPIKDGKRVDAKGEPVTFEFLIDEPTFQPHHMPFIKNLATLGIDATLRVVDPVQFRKRTDEFDFDVTVQRFNFSTTPGDSLRSYFTSQSATMNGSQNLAGIADPVVDALVEKILQAETRGELTIACRALDRVIRAGRYWVPHWYLAAHRIAYWDVFGFPPKKPAFTRGAPETWWYDQEKAAKLERGR
jgi:microcin C transport system substrate-binding protein